MISSFDLSTLQALHQYHTYAGVIAFIWVSELGSSVTLSGLTALLAIYFAYRRHFAYAQGIVLALASGGIGALILKTLVHRARPPHELWGYTETGYSFPSAHATLSVAIWGFIAYLILRSDLSRAAKNISVTMLSVLILLIGFSRLYLGVHYPTDVLGGFLLGGACLWLAITTTRMLEMRSRV